MSTTRSLVFCLKNKGLLTIAHSQQIILSSWIKCILKDKYHKQLTSARAGRQAHKNCCEKVTFVALFAWLKSWQELNNNPFHQIIQITAYFRSLRAQSYQTFQHAVEGQSQKPSQDNFCFTKELDWGCTSTGQLVQKNNLNLEGGNQLGNHSHSEQGRGLYSSQSKKQGRAMVNRAVWPTRPAKEVGDQSHLL